MQARFVIFGNKTDVKKLFFEAVQAIPIDMSRDFFPVCPPQVELCKLDMKQFMGHTFIQTA